MPGSAQHCPFLNRSDGRCAEHFSLLSLSEAFEQCFDQYTTCVVYRELLLERRIRRAEAAVLLRHGIQTVADAAATGPEAPISSQVSIPHGTPIVHLTFSGHGAPRR